MRNNERLCEVIVGQKWRIHDKVTERGFEVNKLKKKCDMHNDNRHVVKKVNRKNKTKQNRQYSTSTTVTSCFCYFFSYVYLTNAICIY